MKNVIFTNQKHIMEEYIPPKVLKPNDVTITVDPKIKYQKHLGFGGALTDAACISFNYLPEVIKEIYLEAYFSKDGLNYNLLRYP